MAISKSTLRAIDDLNDALVLAGAVGEALSAAADEHSAPPWVYVYQRHFELVRAASEKLEAFLIAQVVPQLETLEGAAADVLAGYEGR